MSKNKTNFFRASAEDFKKIPSSPVAYWVSNNFRHAFDLPRIASIATPSQGMSTCDVDRFVRIWSEVAVSRTNTIEGQNHAKWIRYNKGGAFRKWFGNREYVVLWNGNGADLKVAGATLRNQDRYFKRFLAWTKISSGVTGFRVFESDFLFDGAGGTLFLHNERQREIFLAFLNSSVATRLLTVISPTVNFNESHIGALPIDVNVKIDVEGIKRGIAFSRNDWDAYETSWDFKSNPLVAEMRNVSGASKKSEFQIEALYKALRERWARDCEEMRRLETENNRIFIEAYGLQDELTPEVPWHEITLTCNPWYRYGVKVDSGQCAVGSAASDHCTLPTDHLLEERLRGDTVKELISYAVGCMMGRYSLEKPGLILADQGAQISDQWLVVSGQLVLRGKVAECVRKELQRIDCLAEGDGSCGRSVSTGETAPDGGTVCIVGSASSGGGFNSVECRRGAGAEYDAGLHELSDNGTRVVLRDGNTIVDLCSAEVLDAIASGSGAELVRRGWKDAERIDWKTIHSSLTTSHFSPDEDGIIPILNNDWFADDIVTRFKEFVKVAFGESHFFENMAWIEEALGKNLRDYFTKDFYKDHLQRYQNRPIYWLFQSPKGAFRALIYMHRYKPDMVGGVLGYLRSLQTKVENQLGVATQIASDESKSSTERVRANKEVVKYSKMQKELDEYEKHVLYPLSTERIEIDLDDGVKVNYAKFASALAKVKALEAKGE